VFISLAPTRIVIMRRFRRFFWKVLQLAGQSEPVPVTRRSPLVLSRSAILTSRLAAPQHPLVLHLTDSRVAHILQPNS
jgi:hypothetical protein